MVLRLRLGRSRTRQIPPHWKERGDHGSFSPISNTTLSTVTRAHTSASTANLRSTAAGRVISTTAASHRVDGAPEATTAGYPSVIVISKYSSRRRRRSVSVVYRRTSDKWWWASGLLFVSWEEGLELQSEVRVYVLRKRAIRYITVL